MNEKVTPHEALGRRGLIQEVKRVSLKVASELKRPEQIMDPRRVSELFFRYIAEMQAVYKPIDISVAAAEAGILSRGIKEHALKDGTVVGHTLNPALVYTLFPSHSQFSYFNPNSDQFVRLAQYYIRAAPFALDPQSGKIGSTEGQKDAKGIVIPFAHRETTDQIQHGGILIKGDKNAVNILDYEELQMFAGQQLEEDEVLMEGSLFMNDQTSEAVSMRPNLLFPRNYNGIGVIYSDSGKPTLFSITNDPISRLELAKSANLNVKDRRLVTLRQVGGLANILSRRVGGISWKFLGLEFNGGGTYPKESLSDKWINDRVGKIHHFQVHTNP